MIAFFQRKVNRREVYINGSHGKKNFRKEISELHNNSEMYKNDEEKQKLVFKWGKLTFSFNAITKPFVLIY